MPLLKLLTTSPSPNEMLTTSIEQGFLIAASHLLPFTLWGMGFLGIYLGYQLRNRAIFYAISFYAIGLWLVRFNIWMTMLGGIAFAVTLGCLIGFIPRWWFFLQTREWLPNNRNIW